MDLALFRVFTRSALVLLLILPLGALPPQATASLSYPRAERAANLVERSPAAPASGAAQRPPPLGVAPSSLSRSFVFGSAPLTDTQALTLTNGAATALDFLLEERPGGFQIGRPQVNDILLVSRMAPSANTAAATALNNLGYSFDAVTNTVFETKPVTELLTYRTVIYIGNTGVTANSPSNLKLMAYLDAGGRLLIADNNLGFNNGSAALYQTYLDATYGDNNPDPINNNVDMVGFDIMGGLDAPSADPEPDYFTTGSNSVRIFRYAVDQSIGASRISRNGYRAVYIATDFNFLGTSLIGDQIETLIMDRSLRWLIDGLVPDVVDWITEAPTQGTIAAGASRNVAVSWYPGVVNQPGTYTGTLRLEHTLAPTATVDVPVTMLVTPSPAQAKITGVISSSGVCDREPAPLIGATVLISDTGDFFAVVTTDDAGRYTYFLPSAGTYGITVLATDHPETTASIDAVAGTTNVRDFVLRLQKSCITASPLDLAATLFLGDQLTRTVTITSSGAMPLGYRILETTGQTAASSDAYGYVWTTQPAAWLDTSGGVEVNPQDDDVFDYSLPFAFPFYDLPVNEILIGNNGGIIVGTTSGAISFENVMLDAFSAPNYFIAPFWDDFISQSGIMRVKDLGSAPNRAVVVEWNDRRHALSTGAATLQAVLYENGNILYQYQDVMFGDPDFDNGASATIGLRGPDAATVLPYSFNKASLTDGLAICFVRPGNQPCHDIAWLNVSPASAAGVVGTPPTNRVANVGFDTAALSQAGIYTATLAIVHNTPQPVVLIPVSLDAQLPNNYGTINGVVSGLGFCDQPGAPLEGATVRIGMTTPVTVTTNAAGQYTYDLPAGTYTLTIARAGYQSQTVGVEVSAQGVTTTPVTLRRAAPCQSFAPSALSSSLLIDQIVTKTLTISNTGTMPLNWTLEPVAGKCTRPGWLAVSPVSGSAAPGAASAVSVVFDSGGLPDDTYTAGLCLVSNDLLEPTMIIPVSLTVSHGDPQRIYLPLLLR